MNRCLPFKYQNIQDIRDINSQSETGTFLKLESVGRNFQITTLRIPLDFPHRNSVFNRITPTSGDESIRRRRKIWIPQKADFSDFLGYKLRVKLGFFIHPTNFSDQSSHMAKQIHSIQRGITQRIAISELWKAFRKPENSFTSRTSHKQ